MFASRELQETGFSFSDAVPEPPERRREERHLTILRVGILVVDGQHELCLIRNISAGGLMAHVYSPVCLGQRVSVELKSNQRIAGSVAWISDANVGIAFDSTVDVAELLANPPLRSDGWRPRMPRVEIDRLGTVRSGARTWCVHARDISQGGVKLELDEPLEVGGEVVVTLEHFRPLPGIVRWQDGGVCGIAFNALIPFEELIAWLKRG